MAFLVKNVWSLIAHKYSLNTLESSQLTKDELIEKLTSAKKYSIEQTQMVNEQASLNDEMTSLTNNSDVIKEKIVSQNETMKVLIRQMENSKSCSIKACDQNLAKTSNEPFEMVKQTNETDSLVTDNDSFSPGSSPSSFLLNRFQKKLNISTTTTTPDKQTDSKDSKLTPNTQLMTSDFYIFSHGEYIAIDKTIENSNAMIKSHTEDELASCVLFKCDFCHISAESSKVSERIVSRHLKKECLCNYSICMFCMDLYEKDLQEEFEAHVRSHISLSINDT